MNNLKKSVIVCLLVAAAFGAILWGKTQLPQGIPAADRTDNSTTFRWTGRGGDGKWSSPANWDQGRVPTAQAAVVFDGNSSTASRVDADFSGEIASLRVEGYTATITQNKNLRIAGDFYQDAGKYQVVADLEVGGNFTLQRDGSFDVALGVTRIAGVLEITDNFKIDRAEGAEVYVMNNGEWKAFVLDDRGQAGYDATKLSGGEKSAEETWSFYNGTNALNSYVSQEQGWTLGALDGSWSWNYAFARLGREGQAAEARENLGISADKNRITLARGEDLEEWYRNTYQGIEQGFTIAQKPQGEGQLVLAGQVSMKNLNIQESTADTITLSANGTVAFVYSHLSVLDKTGKKLPAQLQLEPEAAGGYELQIVVDDSGAQYPIVIDPLSSSPDWVGKIDEPSAGYGKSASFAGDVNGDGKTDALVTAVNYSNGETYEGKAYLYLGTAAGLATTPAWSYESDYAYAYLGSSASGAGDLNDDGYDDVIIGAEGYNNKRGRLYVFFGSESGLSAVPDWTYTGVQADQNLGWSVSEAGDVNGDGYDDIIAGAYRYNQDGLTDQGQALVFYGRAAGLPAIPDWTTISHEAGAWLGFSVSTAGDVNGDGFSDILVGAPQFGANDEGEALLYRGSAAGLPAAPTQIFSIGSANSFFGNPVAAGGDINGDGWPDILIGASRYDGVKANKGALFAFYGSAGGFSATPNWEFLGEEQENAYMGSALYSAGDVNSDGFDDVVAGSCKFDGGEIDEGKAVLFYGHDSGLSVLPDWQDEADAAGASMGWYAATAGDVNGDGASDFFVSAHLFEDATTGGRAFLYYGADEGGISPEICSGGLDEDQDGDIDLDDTDCDTTVNKSNISVKVSTTDQDNWFDDRCRDAVDNDGDGKTDSADPDCDGGQANDIGLTTYVVCDTPFASYDSPTARKSYIHPHVRDYEYAPCNRDGIHDDYFSTDSNSPLNVQPAEKQFTIRADAADAFGIQSIKIQWFNATEVDVAGNDWNSAIARSFTCNDAGGVSSCTICVKGGGCENDVIDYASLGKPENKKQQRLFFRVVVTDNNGNITTTGYDNDTTQLPVLDKYYRLVICSKDCHDCTNQKPVVTTDKYISPGSFCNGLDYTLDWSFTDPDGDSQAYYEVQVRDKNDLTKPVMTAVRESSNTQSWLFEGFLDNGDLEYNKTYEWRVRAYDDSTEEGCQGTSDWTDWTALDMNKTFSTPAHPYPKPAFTLRNAAGKDCEVAGNCTFLADVILDGSTSTVSLDPASYQWYTFKSPTDPEAATVFSVSNPATAKFLEADGLNHTFRMTVQDADGHACTLDKSITLAKPQAKWNEVAPTAP